MTDDQIEAVSNTVFGSSKRLSLLNAVATASGDDLYPAKLAELSGGRQNQVGLDLRKLQEVGLLKSRKVKGSTRLYYSKSPSVLWEFATKLYAESTKRRAR